MIIKGNARNNTRTGSAADDTIYGYRGNDTLRGLGGDDHIYGGYGADKLFAGGGFNYLYGGAGNDYLNGYSREDFTGRESPGDFFDGGSGNDRIIGGRTNDIAYFNATTDGADLVELRGGYDKVVVDLERDGHVRLTVTPVFDGLDIHLQAEDSLGDPIGPTSLFQDNDVVFVGAKGVKFTVSDPVSHAQPSRFFDVVSFGDLPGPLDPDLAHYVDGGSRSDRITAGRKNDFLVGGLAGDTLIGNRGNDTFVGGLGKDKIFGGPGKDLAILNASTDGADLIDLADGADRIRVTADAAAEVRLTFTGTGVGDGNAVDAGQKTGEDGGLAVRLQIENGSDGVTGPISRIDDEGIAFAAGDGVTFDLRNLVNGAAWGNNFKAVVLGTWSNDVLTSPVENERTYLNGGKGIDVLKGGTGNDVLTGGYRTDTVTGGAGDDVFLFGVPVGNHDLDKILDYSHADDSIWLDRSFFPALARGPLAPGAFALTTDPAEADDRIIYNPATGRLLYDADGGTRSGWQEFAVLVNTPADLAADDFLII